MKSRSKKRVIPIMIKVVIITLLIVGTIFGSIVILFIGMEEKQKIKDEEMKIRKAETIKRAENYLEKKYGKKFIVNPDGFNDIESFIPGKVENNYRVCYEASSLDDPNYVFRVYFYINKNNNQYNEQIRDNYCWKFLREDLRRKIEDKVGLTLDSGYKFEMWLSPDITFNYSISQNSNIEEYFKNTINGMDISIYIFSYKSEDEVEKKIKDNMEILLNNIKNESENARIYCTYFVTSNKIDFDSIDIHKEERYNLMISQTITDKSYKSSGLMDVEEKFKIIK